MPAPQVTPATSPLVRSSTPCEDALGAAHLPQHVDVDRALAAGDLIGALDLRDGAVDRILDQFLVPLAPRQRW